MKNIWPFIKILSLAGVIVLFILQFNQPDEKVKSVPLPSGSADKLNIVHVDMEKLLLEYDYSVRLNEEFLQEKKRLEGEMRTELEKFEKEANKYQEKLARGGFVSTASAENQKQQLVKKQEELQQLQMKLENDWFTKEQELETLLYDAIIGYLEEISKTNGYDYILSKVMGGNVLVGAESLDVTEQVIIELNQRYQASIGND